MSPKVKELEYLIDFRDCRHRDVNPLHLHVCDVLETPDRLLGGISTKLQEIITQIGYLS